MKSLRFVLSSCLLATGSAAAATYAIFVLSASADDWARYFPSYLANGYFSTMTAPRGTEALRPAATRRKIKVAPEVR